MKTKDLKTRLDALTAEIYQKISEFEASIELAKATQLHLIRNY